MVRPRLSKESVDDDCSLKASNGKFTEAWRTIVAELAQHTIPARQTDQQPYDGSRYYSSVASIYWFYATHSAKVGSILIGEVRRIGLDDFQLRNSTTRLTGVVLVAMNLGNFPFSVQLFQIRRISSVPLVVCHTWIQLITSFKRLRSLCWMRWPVLRLFENAPSIFKEQCILSRIRFLFPL